MVWAGLNPAPDTPLNVEIGPHRRFVGVRGELRDFKLVKDAFGGTINDVVLTVVSGSLREWLRSRGVRTEGLELRALVPVSIRAEHEKGAMGNRIAVDARPAAGLHRGPDRAAAHGQAVDGRAQGVQAGGRCRGALERPELRAADDPGAGLAAELLDAAVQPDRDERAGPAVPALRARPRDCRRSSRSRSCPKNHALAIAIMSYNGRINFGLLGDYDALPDLDRIGDGIEASLAELMALAKKAQKQKAAGSGSGGAANGSRAPAPARN